MSTTSTPQIVISSLRTERRLASRARVAKWHLGVSWEIGCCVLAVASSVIGMEWDIAWHRSIGRDSFWTPAHMMIQACGVLTAIVCGYLVYACTFGRSESDRERRRSSVGVLGLRAPLGCFLAAWGGIAMLVSAPFDNWWHNAYGLDVQILSPPHTLLFVGLRTISAGLLLLILGAMNRAASAPGGDFALLQRLFLVMGGLIVAGHMVLITASVDQTMLHNTTAYKNMTLAVLVMLPLLSQASRHRWAASWATGIYTALRIAEVLIFPLFPATPRLGPVLNPVTHLVPAQFPILLIIPALALDLLWQRAGQLRPWVLAMASGVVFEAALLAAEWPFANFLMSKASENRFFNTMDFDFSAPLADRMHHFSFAQSGGQLAHGMLLTTVYACLACWVGLRLGRWMRSVER